MNKKIVIIIALWMVSSFLLYSGPLSYLNGRNVITHGQHRTMCYPAIIVFHALPVEVTDVWIAYNSYCRDLAWYHKMPFLSKPRIKSYWKYRDSWRKAYH